MNLTEKFKEVIDEYNSKCKSESDKIIFDKISDIYCFRRLFTYLFAINSDFIVYSSYLDYIKEDEDLRKILEIVEEERMERKELLKNIEKAIGWINGEILNYKEVLNFFNINVNMNEVSIFHKDDDLISVDFESLEVIKEDRDVSEFEDYISTLYNILQNIVKGYNVFYIKEDEDDMNILYNLFILDIEKFKKSKYIKTDDDISLVEKGIMGVYKELSISDKYKLGFSNRLYIEEYYSYDFKNLIELINNEDESIEKKITDILLKDDYNTSFEDIKISDKHNMIEIDTKFVKFIYKKEDEKLMASRFEDFEFDELRDFSEDMKVIESEISKLLRN